MTKLRTVYCWVCQWVFFKSVNIWHSYKQERDCLVHFFRLFVAWWPGAQSARGKHLLACSVAKYYTLNKVCCYTTSGGPNEPCISWGGESPPPQGNKHFLEGAFRFIVKYREYATWALQNGWVDRDAVCGSDSRVGYTLAPPGEYNWMIRARWRCGLMSHVWNSLPATIRQLRTV